MMRYVSLELIIKFLYTLIVVLESALGRGLGAPHIHKKIQTFELRVYVD
jgi:hypothetical protein